MLNAEEKRKYVRQIMLRNVGTAGMQKIRAASVAVVGCGGLGCPVSLYLAAAGVGRLGLIDFDTISITNLHRQVLYGEGDVGKKKTSTSTEKLNTLHTTCTIETHDVMLSHDNAPEILGRYDIVIDGSDNFDTRYLVNDVCAALHKPLVYGSILDLQGQLAVFNYKRQKNLRHIFPEPPSPGEVPDCSENGVLATVPGVIGTMMAHLCMMVILEQAEESGTLKIVDLREMSVRGIRY